MPGNRIRPSGRARGLPDPWRPSHRWIWPRVAMATLTRSRLGKRSPQSALRPGHRCGEPVDPHGPRPPRRRHTPRLARCRGLPAIRLGRRRRRVPRVSAAGKHLPPPGRGCCRSTTGKRKAQLRRSARRLSDRAASESRSRSRPRRVAGLSPAGNTPMGSPTAAWLIQNSLKGPSGPGFAM